MLRTQYFVCSPSYNSHGCVVCLGWHEISENRVSRPDSEESYFAMFML